MTRRRIPPSRLTLVLLASAGVTLVSAAPAGARGRSWIYRTTLTGHADYVFDSRGPGTKDDGQNAYDATRHAQTSYDWKTTYLNPVEPGVGFDDNFPSGGFFAARGSTTTNYHYNFEGEGPRDCSDTVRHDNPPGQSAFFEVTLPPGGFHAARLPFTFSSSATLPGCFPYKPKDDPAFTASFRVPVSALLAGKRVVRKLASDPAVAEQHPDLCNYSYPEAQDPYPLVQATCTQRLVWTARVVFDPIRSVGVKSPARRPRCHLVRLAPHRRGGRTRRVCAHRRVTKRGRRAPAR